MAWARTAGKTAAKYGVKYGPHAVAVWKIAGSHVESAARNKMDEVTARRTAFDHAGGTTDGSVLRLVDRGRVLFVVYSGKDPVASYPEAERPLAELTMTADLVRRVTPEQHRERRLRARARRAGGGAVRRARRH
ncbi:MAG: hypothetical protein ABI776_05220 [Nocardioidaceae bacterium]